MGKRTSQATPPSQPRPRRKNRSLVGILVRWLAIVVAVVAVLFLIGGWFYSGRIESGALAPPTNEPPDYAWEVTDTGTSVSLLGSEDTDQAGQAGLSGIAWDGGYARSPALVSSNETSDGYVDIRSIDPQTPAPPVGTDVRVDAYYWDSDPMEALGIPFEDVTYTSDVGTFPAWYIEGTTDTWAIIAHGKWGTRAEGLRIIPTLADLGYHILVIEYRNDVGEPRDPSGHYTYGESDYEDIVAAVIYAREHGATDHVLVGYSYAGSMITSYLTQSPLRNSTKAVILDSPVLSFTDTVDFRASETSLPLLPFTVPQALTDFSKWVTSWRFDVDWGATDYLDKTGEIHAPMLIFHGTSDTSVPYETSRELANRRPDIVTLITTDAGHTRSWNVDPVAYDAAITEFLEGVDS
jgi:pimeloyl-ACP methyl ester carboxylesterase